MKLQATAVSAICLLCSMVLFPLFFFGSVIALFIVAAGAEALRFLMGGSRKGIDVSATRAAA
jgi:hypothetical protein